MVGVVTALVVAVAILRLAADREWRWQLGFGFVGAGRDWDGWPFLSALVLAAAWVNVAAWLGRVWSLAIVCSLLTFAAPWGFIYPGILAGPILAVAAAVAWLRTKQPRSSSGMAPSGNA